MNSLFQRRHFVILVGLLIFLFGSLFGFFVQPYASVWFSFDDPVWAVYGDGQLVRKSDVWPLIEKDLAQLESNIYKIQKKATSEFIRKKILEDISKQSRLSAEAFLSRATEKHPLPTDKEIDAFLADRGLKKDKLSKAELLNAVNNLHELQKQEAHKRLLVDALEKAAPRYSIPRHSERRVEISPGLLLPRGSEKAPIKLVLFGHFHCPFCPSAAARLREIEKAFGEKVVIHFRFAVGDPPDSIVSRSAEAAFCANDQGRFWDYFERLMMSPPTQDLDLLSAATQLSLNSAEFETCLKQRKNLALVSDDNKVFVQEGFSEIPVFIVNGRVLRGLAPLDEIADIAESNDP